MRNSAKIEIALYFFWPNAYVGDLQYHPALGGGGSTVMPQTLTASPLTLNYFKGGEEEGNSASCALISAEVVLNV